MIWFSRRSSGYQSVKESSFFDSQEDDDWTNIFSSVHIGRRKTEEDDNFPVTCNKRYTSMIINASDKWDKWLQGVTHHPRWDKTVDTIKELVPDENEIGTIHQLYASLLLFGQFEMNGGWFSWYDAPYQEGCFYLYGNGFRIQIILSTKTAYIKWITEAIIPDYERQNALGQLWSLDIGKDFFYLDHAYGLKKDTYCISNHFPDLSFFLSAVFAHIETLNEKLTTFLTPYFEEARNDNSRCNAKFEEEEKGPANNKIKATLGERITPLSIC